MPYFQVEFKAHACLLIEADTRVNAKLMTLSNTDAQ